MDSLPRQVDVIVMGGGPAGSATTLLLGKAGLSTLILNPARKYFSLGETLPAAAAPVLRHLGVWDSFCEQHQARLAGIASAWGGSSLECRDLFSTHGGSGWILDRARFDDMLLHFCKQVSTVAIPQGAILVDRPPVRNGWRVHFRESAGERTVSCRYLVNATGKGGIRCLPVSNRRTQLDRLIGAVTFFEGKSAPGYALVETVDDGWFYSAPVSNSKTAVVYFTDADIYAVRRRKDPEYFVSQLKRTIHTSARIHSLVPLTSPKVVSAVTSHMNHTVGCDWISVGDASCSFDPMSSLGIFKAIDSAARACSAVIDSLRGRANWNSYGKWLDQVFKTYLRTRETFYGQEQRWKSPFWQRRHA